MTADHDLFKGSIALLAGTLDKPEELEQAKAGVEFYTKYKVSWLPTYELAMQKTRF